MIAWHPAARTSMADHGIDERTVIGVIREPVQTQVETTRTGKPAVLLRRGDVVVCLGMEKPTAPMVLWVRRRRRVDDLEGARGGAGGQGDPAPKTLLELRKRIVALGLRIVPGMHDRVVDPDRNGAVVTTLPSTPSDFRSIPNTWADVRRYMRRQEGAA